ncbi:MAG: hypothetical protein ACJAXB_002800, partial [Candidatus Endobugula sp.]
MNLFPEEIDETKNWLPQDGEVNYYGRLVTAQEADTYYNALLENIEWKND